MSDDGRAKSERDYQRAEKDDKAEMVTFLTEIGERRGYLERKAGREKLNEEIRSAASSSDDLSVFTRRLIGRPSKPGES